ncbi:MAG: small subunit ribosomal protein [Planctomycetota bacterium]|jgi:small subunit ribosomal protein S5
MKPKIRYLDGLEVDGLELEPETLIRVNRSAATVKGGRSFSFGALSISGNKKGIVGYGYGKSRQVPGAIEKAARDGRKHLQRVPLTEHGSIPHEVEAWYGGSMVRLIPASAGTGIIAAPPVRAVCEMAGVKNILSKCYGSTNPTNIVKASLAALAQLRTPDQVAQGRGVNL